MKFCIPKCPKCGKAPYATCENVPGLSILQEPDAEGEQDYEGETELNWDAQTSDETPEGVLVVCANFHEWRTQVLEPST